MAAAARIHRRDELKPRRIDDAVVCAGDCHFAGFERLAYKGTGKEVVLAILNKAETVNALRAFCRKFFLALASTHS
jgi:hypothetical protein